MPLRDCSQSGCCLPAERSRGTCPICGHHYCLAHLKGPQHECLTSDDGDAYYEACRDTTKRCLNALVKKINFEGLKTIASLLRGGMRCEIPALEDPQGLESSLASQMGGQNCHADIKFDDNVVWIARFRLEEPIHAPVTIRDYVTRSEIATLRFLAELPIPTVCVHHFTLSTTLDEVGVPYVLMDKLPGNQIDYRAATQEQRAKVLEQLADYAIALRKRPFRQSGSLLLDTDGKSLTIGPYAMMQLWKNTTQGLGPYDTPNEAYHAILGLYLGFYLSRELDHLPLESFLSHKWRQNVVDRVYNPDESNGTHNFYLKHQDDTGSHILVNDDFDITGVIDWETATLEVDDVAFSSPLMLWPVGEFYEGDNKLAADEVTLAKIFTTKGEPEMAKFIEQGRFHQRLFFFLRDPWTREDFIGLFDGLRRAAAQQSTDSDEVLSYVEWLDDALISSRLR